MRVLSALTSCDTFRMLCRCRISRYLATFQMLSLSARNSFPVLLLLLLDCIVVLFRGTFRYVFEVRSGSPCSSLALCLVCCQYVYMRRSCVRSVVYYRLAYGDGLAFGVRVWTASGSSPLACLSVVAKVPSAGLVSEALEILALISFQGAFIRRRRSCCFGVGTEISKTVSIAQ